MNEQTPIEELDPAVRIFNILKRSGINTLGDLATVDLVVLFRTCPTAQDAIALGVFLRCARWNMILAARA